MKTLGESVGLPRRVIQDINMTGCYFRLSLTRSPSVCYSAWVRWIKDFFLSFFVFCFVLVWIIISSKEERGKYRLSSVSSGGLSSSWRQGLAHWSGLTETSTTTHSSRRGRVSVLPPICLAPRRLCRLAAVLRGVWSGLCASVGWIDI